jgi:predicted glycoside hydrolase/deacetylase ChbG (UPF0249 family)
MINMPDAQSALEMAAEYCPNLGLGVHLTLTAGLPLLTPEQLPTLTRLSDGTRFPREAVLREQAASIPAAEVKAEWRAQIECFIQRTGKKPDHLDSHHNSSYYTYPFFEAMLELAAEYQAAVRLCYGDAENGDYTAIPKDFPADATPHELTRRFNIPAPDSFIGGFYDKNVSDSAGVCGWLRLAQTVHEFSQINECKGLNSSIRGPIRGWFTAKPQIPLEPGNF